MIRQAFKDLSRLRDIALVAARHGFGQLLERTRLWELIGRRERTQPTPEEARESTARRFRLLLSDLGPTFIKLGQILSSRPDALPVEYIQELSLLQDAVPPEPMEHVLRQIEQSLGRPASELFGHVDEVPLASASIAQVHRAQLLDGTEVVVKVQRPGIAERIHADVDLLFAAARTLEAVVEETGIYTPTGIVEEFDLAIRDELDFLNEARNLKEFRENQKVREYVVVPRVFEELTSRTVLTMEFLRGEPIRSIDLEKHDRKLLAQRLIEGAFRQLFEDGLFHGDPHPGNILVMEGEKLGLLDLGVIGRVTKQMQENLVLLVLAVSLKDADTVARLLYRIATPDKRSNLSAFRSEIQGVLDRYLTKATTLSQIDARTLLPELLDLAVRYHIRIPKEYAILSRAAVAVEGLIRWLHPQLNIAEAVMPYAKELLLGRYESMGLGATGMRMLLRFQTFATDVPVQLSQILLDLESGKFRVNIASEDLDQINRSLKGLGFISFLGFIACGLTIGVFYSFSKIDHPVHGVPLMGALALISIAVSFGAVAMWTLASGRIRKISISRWLQKKPWPIEPRK
jgi:ubiquinone biosynthesis protein